MNPDDIKALLALKANLAAGGGPGIPPAAAADQTSTANMLPQDAQLAAARMGVLKARQAGYSDPEIDQFVRQKYGTPLNLIMAPQQSDYMRSLGAGATLGFNDELTGAVSKLLGGNYTQARDQVRAQQAAASAIAPKRMAATEMAGAALPGLLTGGIVNPATSAPGRVAQATAVGAGLGGASGLGHSTATDPMGMLSDVGSGAGAGALAGSLFSLAPEAVSFLRNRGAQTVAQAARYAMPSNAAQTIARQEAMAPGTSSIAGLSPETVPLARGVGVDLKTANAARAAADARVQALDAARQRIGQQYQVLSDRRLPVDDNLRSIVGGNMMLPGQDVSFGDVQSLRSDLAAKLRAAQKAYNARGEQGNVIADLAPRKAALDQWLQGQVPGLSQVDNDYAFAMNRLQAAKALRKQVGQSLSSNASVGAAGMTAQSPAAQLASPSHLISTLLDKVLAPSKAARAGFINELLMTPGGAAKVLAPPPGAVTAPFYPIGGGLLAGLSDLLTR